MAKKNEWPSEWQYYSQDSYKVKPGDTPKKVANQFGVSVQELLSYNSVVLNDRWDAGKVVKDPKHQGTKLIEAINLGATAEDLASVLRMSVDDVVSKYNVLRKDELQDIPKPTKKLKETLKEISVEAKRVPEKLLQEVTVDAKRVPEKLLQEVTVDAK